MSAPPFHVGANVLHLVLGRGKIPRGGGNVRDTNVRGSNVHFLYIHGVRATSLTFKCNTAKDGARVKTKRLFEITLTPSLDLCKVPGCSESPNDRH